MEELVVPYVNTNVGNAAGIGVGEEHQVADLQIRTGNRSADCPLLLGSAGQLDAVGGEDILDKPGAIKTCGGSAAPDIGNAQILLCGGNDLVAQVCSGAAAFQGRSAGSNAGRFATPEEEGCVGGCGVLIGVLGQIQVIAADIADLVAVDDLKPLVIDADDVRPIA